jgi:hypothetical protein
MGLSKLVMGSLYLHIPKFIKIPPVGAQLFHADGQRDRQKAMILIYAIRCFAKA